MIERIVGASVLILAVMAIRGATKGKISMRMRYALWLMVALRLVIPASVGSSAFSVMNLCGMVGNRLGDMRAAGFLASEDAGRDGYTAGNVSEGAEGNRNTTGREAEYTAGNGTGYLAGTETHFEGTGAAGSDFVSLGAGLDLAATDAEHLAGNHALSVRKDGATNRLFYALIGIWITGAAAVGSYMTIAQIRFAVCLSRKRETVSAHDLLPEWAQRLRARGIGVYSVKDLPGPCMAGRNIYINPRLLGGQDRLAHVLAHEYSHAAQGDALWAFARCVLCAAYWFHPLVWLAAYEAKQDSELACDERAVLLLGEGERFAYGRTLLGLASDGCRQEASGLVLLMNGSRRRMQERIAFVAGKKKKSRTAVGVTALTALILCGCAFTGAQAADGSGETAADRAAQADAELAEKMEQSEAEAIGGRFDEMDEEEQQRQREEAEADESLLEDEEEARRKRQEEEAFKTMLHAMDDTALAEAGAIDRMAYYEYLYEGGECPMEDGAWYLIHQSGSYGIDFYGLYTKEYGSRGVKVLIDGDVNTYDMPWRSAVFQSGVAVMVLEQTGEGLPRTFAFKMCEENTGRSEIWRLYLADRYDTGTIDLYAFDVEDCRRQFGDLAGFHVDREEEKVYVTYGEDVVTGAIDLSKYGAYTVQEAVWDDGTMGYYFDYKNKTITFVTCIGFKVAEDDGIKYEGLPVIGCPVELGGWDSRSFTLGPPFVSEEWVGSRLDE